MPTWKESLEAVQKEVEYTNELKEKKIPLIPHVSPKSQQTRDFIDQLQGKARKHK